MYELLLNNTGNFDFGSEQELNCTWKIILSFTSKSGCALRDCSIQIEMWYKKAFGTHSKVTTTA